MRLLSIFFSILAWTTPLHGDVLKIEKLPELKKYEYRWLVVNANQLWLQVPGGIYFAFSYDPELAQSSSDTPYRVSEGVGLPSLPKNEWVRHLK